MFQQVGEIRLYCFNSFTDHGLNHAVFTRQGGISPKPWNSLNFGASVGDDIERVRQNRQLALDVLGRKPESVFDVYQVHSTEVIVTNRSLGVNEPHQKADAILTDAPQVTLLMRFADCVPIFLFDPVKRVIGLVHAGWVGTVNRIVAKTIARMQEEYGTHPAEILAAIGPSIGPDHYAVRNDVIDHVSRSYGNNTKLLITNRAGKTYLDLWKANEVTMSEAGVKKIEIAQICTACHPEDWYSHRGEFGTTGRFGAILCLR